MDFSNLKWIFVVLAIGFTAVSCRETSSNPPNSTPAPKSLSKRVPSTPLAKKTVELGEPTWNPRWNWFVVHALPPSMLSRLVPSDVQHFCPRFYAMNKKEKHAFWAYFFQALSGAEATLNPRAKAPHTEPVLAARENVPATRVMTEGLLQLTYADASRYGCNFNERADRRLAPDDPRRSILQPKNNLECGVKILANQIIDQHKPIVSPTSYWATLRPGTAGYHTFIQQMADPPRACELHPAGHSPKGSLDIARR